MYTRSKLLAIINKIPENQYVLKRWADGIIRRYDSLDKECSEFASAISITNYRKEQETVINPNSA